MEVVVGVAALVVLVMLVGLVVVLVRRMKTTQRVEVAEMIPIGGQAESAEPGLAAALSSVTGVEVMKAQPLAYALVLRRVPVWAIIPVLLLFPVGLVFLLVRETIRMEVTLHDSTNGAFAMLSGRSERVVLDRVRAAVGRVGLNAPNA